jgi:hypothetical protein
MRVVASFAHAGGPGGCLRLLDILALAAKPLRPMMR